MYTSVGLRIKQIQLVIKHVILEAVRHIEKVRVYRDFLEEGDGKNL